MLVARALVNLAAVWLAAVAPASGAVTRRSDGSQVDLGYAIYKGDENATSGLTVWKGIRYAAPPIGKLRWQAPRLPETNRTTVVLANTFGARCPQQPPAPGRSQPSSGDEDCLYLNVWAPRNASARSSTATRDGGPGSSTGGAPVLVVIHGGGYGQGDGMQDMTGFLNSNGNRFIVVAIQYRLGAFGFLASPEVKARGVLNAGLLDQEFALKWTQQHIAKFGGDPKRVTIYGESAGGGSVMLLSIARGGKTGTSLFKNGIAASPYLPTQPYYDDKIPRDRFAAFASAVGCSGSGDVFDCLVSANTSALVLANAQATGPGSTVAWGNWAFIPVTDGEYLTERPSVSLAKKAVNGERILSAGNANEGSLFVPTNISTEAGLRAWIKGNFVNLSEQNITAILNAYPGGPGPDDPNSPRFETDGLGPATAVNVSQAATGHQQRAYNIYAEATFVCPAYWLADAFGSSCRGRESFFYQYSIPFASHGADYGAAFANPSPNQGPDFISAFRQIYGNYIVGDNPSIADTLANGPSSPDPTQPNPASRWPRWTARHRAFLNLNETGGTPFTTTLSTGAEITEFSEPGLRNAFSLADAYTWEGGRGRRCDFWKTINAFIPQ